jgi:ParB-like chromosome segregation protein Spo0J
VADNGHDITIETRKVAELQPAPWNPRVISDASLGYLRESIHRWGLVEPIIVNKRTGHMVGGHQRARVLQADGVTDTQVVVVDLPESEEKALNVTLNNPHAAGEFSADLQDLLDEIKAAMPEIVKPVGLEALEVVIRGDPDGKPIDESIGESVGLVKCPKCGHEFPQ